MIIKVQFQFLFLFFLHFSCNVIIQNQLIAFPCDSEDRIYTTTEISGSYLTNNATSKKFIKSSFQNIGNQKSIKKDTLVEPKSKFSQKKISENEFGISSAIQDSSEVKEAHKKQNKKLRFSKNIGQTDKRVLYQVNDMQADHFFMENEIRTVLTMPEKEKTKKTQGKKKGTKPSKRVARKGQEEKENDDEDESKENMFSYGLKFLGTKGPKELVDLHPEIIESVGKKNYIKGNGKFTNIPQYGQVQYKSLWKGIDVDFYESQGQLKYDFLVAPFADPSLIQFIMSGVSNLRVDTKTGELAFTTPLGELKKGVPFTYQIINDLKTKVESKYTIKNGIVSFKLGDYDQNYPLIIDPIALKFATFLGGNGNDQVNDIYVHPTSKKIYLTGITSSSSFPGVTGVASGGGDDGFITCMSKDGSTVLWTTIIGGNEGNEEIHKIHVSDDENDIFISGNTRSNDYPTDGLLAPFSANQAGINNPIISRLNGDGTVLKYSTYFPVSSYALERYTVIGDIVYGATYYDDNDAVNYPITMPAGAYQATPVSSDGSTSEDGQIFFGINTSLSGEASFQYGTFWYDETPDSYSYLEFSDSDSDAAGNIYFGGYIDIGEPINGPENLFPAGGIQTVSEIQNTLTEDGTYSPVGWIAQFDPALSSLIYATPVLPILHNDYLEFAGYDWLFNMDVTDGGDIYMSHPMYIYDVTDFNNLSIAPTAKYNNLQPLKIDSGNDLLLNVTSKIASSNRTQFEYIITAAGEYSYAYSAGAVVDQADRLHWVFPKDQGDVDLEALVTDGALQNSLINNDQTQYVILSPSGDVEYATIVGPSIDLGSNMYSEANASFVTDDGEFYLGGVVDQNAQRSFPVTTSYWDTETSSQVFVYDATPTNNREGWLAVFHEPAPSDNMIDDFAVGNNTFCVDGMIYQDPDYGPILGDPIGYQSGDGSVVTHVLPDIRPSAFTEPHPSPDGANSIIWEKSYDNGLTWIPISGSNSEVYKPEPESLAGVVQYRRVYNYGNPNTPIYSNIATATISGTFGLELESPSEPIYFCPSTVEDFTFPITGATGNIAWQWYDGFAPVDNSVINPSSGTDLPANFLATLPASASRAGSYRLVVEDGSGCAKEATVTFIPLTDDAGVSPMLAICPGDATNDATLGPSFPNPTFEYSWTGPLGFTSSDPNPVVSVDGTYYLQVKLVGEPTFCVGGETSVEVLPLTAHDLVLKDTTINLTFCQSDAPTPIGLTGPAPSGYVFQWSPAISLDDPSAFNPTFYPGTLAFGPPESNINYVFSALRLSDGCIFEDTIFVSTTALAEANAGNDENVYCVNNVTLGSSSSGEYFEWRAVETNFPGGLSALISDPAFMIDGSPVNLGTNKFANVEFPEINSGSYYIDFELQSSYIPLPNICFTADTMRLNNLGCGGNVSIICPNITSSSVQGSSGVCDVAGNQLEVGGLSGATYEWTTYSIDGVLQPVGTEPRGLFEVVNDVQGNALSSVGPHPRNVATDLQDLTWGWPSAGNVEYQVTASSYVGDSLLVCSDIIRVYTNVTGAPVIDVNGIEICNAPSPGTLLTGNGVNIPYTISGTDYNSAPNSSLVWSWSGGSIVSDEDSPFPTIDPVTSTDYYVIASDSITGCFSIDTFEVVIVDIVANSGSDITTACEGSVVRIGSTARTNHTYQWTPSTGLNFPIGTPNSTVAQPYLSVPNIATEYVLISTESNTGCQTTDTIQIAPAIGAPIAPTAAAYTSCQDDNLVIGELYSPSTGITFSWSAGAGADINWLDNINVNQPNVNIPVGFVNPATFMLTVTNGNCGSSSTDYTISPITINPPVPTAATYTSCPDGELLIGRLYSPSDGITFSWSAGTGADISWLDNINVNQTNVKLPSSFSGSAIFTLTVSDNCGSSSRDYTINNLEADVALGPDVTAVCEAPLTEIGSAAQTAGFNYSWSPSNGLFIDEAGTTPYVLQNINTVYAKPTSVTEYTLVASNSSSGCLFFDRITVNPPVGVDVDAGNDKVLCPGEVSVSIGQSGSGTITWAATGYNSDPSGALATPSNAYSIMMMGYLSSPSSVVTSFSQGTFAAGVYRYEVTADYGGGCIASDEVMVTVSDMPRGLAGSSRVLCNGESLTLGATGVAGVNYNWSIINQTALSGTISNTTIANPSVDPQETTSYRLTYQDVVTGCEMTEVIAVTVVAKPNLNDATIGSLCAPVSAQDLEAEITNYGSLTSAVWYIDYEGGTIESNPTGVQPARTTEYFLIGYNSNGCRDEAKVTVLVESPITPSILSDINLNCALDSIDLVDYQGQPSDSNNSFEWHSDNTTNPSSLISNTDVGVGTYYLFEITPSGCASSSASLTISFTGLPLTADASNYTIMNEGKKVKLSGAATGGTGSYSFYWEELGSNSSDIIVTPWGVTTYNLIVTDGAGCIAKDSVTIDTGKQNCKCN